MILHVDCVNLYNKTGFSQKFVFSSYRSIKNTEKIEKIVSILMQNEDLISPNTFACFIVLDDRSDTRRTICSTSFTFNRYALNKTVKERALSICIQKVISEAYYRIIKEQNDRG